MQELPAPPAMKKVRWPCPHQMSVVENCDVAYESGWVLNLWLLLIPILVRATSFFLYCFLYRLFLCARAGTALFLCLLQDGFILSNDPVCFRFCTRTGTCRCIVQAGRFAEPGVQRLHRQQC